MRARLCTLVLALMQCMLMAPGVFCDVVHLQNGNSLRGFIVPADDGTVRLEIPGGWIELPSEQVKAIEENDLGYVVEESGHAATTRKEPAEPDSQSPQTDAAVSGSAPIELPPEKIAELDKLLSALRSEDVRAVDKAYDALVASGKEAVPYLSNALDDASPTQVPYLMAALYKIDRAEAFGAVAATASHEDAAVRQSAVILLGEMQDSRATKVLVTSLSDGKYYVRREAARALGRIGDSAALPALVRATRDNDPEVRAAAAEAIRAITSEQ
jgi:HEAT repeat protein